MIRRFSEKYDNSISRLSELCSRPIISAMFFILYKAILDIMYVSCVGGEHAFFYLSTSLINIVNGWIITVIMAISIGVLYKQNTPSAIMIVIFNMIYFLPMTTYCAYGGGSASFLFWGIIYWCIIIILQIKVPFYVFKSEGTMAPGKKTIVIIYILIALPVFTIWARFANFRLLLSLNDVYVARAEAAQYAIPTAFRYILSMIPLALGMLMALALNQKMYPLVLFLLLTMYVNFSIDGSKSVLFFPLIIIGGYILYRNKMINLIFPGGILIQLVAIIDHFKGGGWIMSMVFRRMGFMLPQLSEYYYRFFKNHPIDFFRQGIIGKLGFDSIYAQPISKVIGNNFKSQIINCNNGLMADVWANLGTIGIVIMPLVIIYCLRLFDLAAHKVDSRLIIGLVFYYAMSFTNSQWSTVLITHGFVLMCVLLLFFPRNKEGKDGTV